MSRHQSINLGSPFICFLSNCCFPHFQNTIWIWIRKLFTFSKPSPLLNHISHLYLRSLNLVRFVSINLDFWSLRHMHWFITKASKTQDDEKVWNFDLAALEKKYFKLHTRLSQKISQTHRIGQLSFLSKDVDQQGVRKRRKKWMLTFSQTWLWLRLRRKHQARTKQAWTILSSAVQAVNKKLKVCFFFRTNLWVIRCCRIISTEELHFQAFVDQFQPKSGVRGYFLTNSGLFLPFFLRWC